MIKLNELLENNNNEKEEKQDFSEYNAPLTKDEKKLLIGTIGQYNSFREGLKANSIRECATKINKAINLAERYITAECNEWMQAEMAKKDIKEIKKMSEKMLSEVGKLKAIESAVEMLYEDIGMRLNRYFDIN